MNKWQIVKAEDIINFNPRESIKKGVIAKKIAMERLQPFARDVSGYDLAEFKGGTKFRNGDIIMARITPCLENGKTAKVNVLNEDEIGFGSTEYIVMRAKEGISDADYVYYLSLSPLFRDIAIKSMVGTSGRQRVQIDVLKSMELHVPTLEEQVEIGKTLRVLDDKIEINKKINGNLDQIGQMLFEKYIINDNSHGSLGLLSDIAIINPRRSMKKGSESIYIEMRNLPTQGSFPLDWTTRVFNGGMKFTNGDTIIARITPCLENGKMAYINFLEENTIAFGSTEYIVIASKDDIYSEMFYFLARHLPFVHYAITNMTGSSGRQRVSGDILGKFELRLPTSESVEQFGKAVNPIMEIIKTNCLENRKLSFIRDTLLSKLFTSEIEL